MLHYNNVEYLNTPEQPTICFACDDVYFQKYGQYTLNSCIATDQAAHCHIINPSNNSLEIANKLKNESVSFSIESLDTSNLHKYQLLSYYFCSRFFVANDLFKKFSVNSLWITDTDVWFNEKINQPANKKLCVDYKPDANNLWKQTTGNLIFVHRDKQQFLTQVINEYLQRYYSTNFKDILDNLDKITKSNLVGLDQVSMAVVIDKYYKNDQDFSTLSIIPKLKGKHKDGVKIWIPVGKSKDCIREHGFRDIKQ
jgi:hypothetical protein